MPAMPRFLRYVRIAFSATCLVACVLLIVLWVRSYWTWDFAFLRLAKTDGVRVSSFSGVMFVFSEPGAHCKWVAKKITSRMKSEWSDTVADELFFGFGILQNHTNAIVFFPHWCVTI